MNGKNKKLELKQTIVVLAIGLLVSFILLLTNTSKLGETRLKLKEAQDELSFFQSALDSCNGQYTGKTRTIEPKQYKQKPQN